MSALNDKGANWRQAAYKPYPYRAPAFAGWHPGNQVYEMHGFSLLAV
jgi:hypothetical protein